MRGEVIKERLSKIGKSQVELAKLLNVHPTTISEIFTSSDVKTGTLEKISSALNLPITFFYDDILAKEMILELNERVEISTIGKMRETSRLGEKIQSLLSSQGKNIEALCAFIDKTEAGLKKMFERDSCNIDVLKKFSEYFEVPVTYFLPESKPNPTTNSKTEHELNYLRGKVEAYEKALEVLGATDSSRSFSTPPH